MLPEQQTGTPPDRTNEADFRAYRVTPQVGRTDFDNPLAHAPLPELDLGLDG